MNNTQLSEIGKRFGRLVVLEETNPKFSPSGIKRRMYSCLCDCGNIKKTRRQSLIRGYTKSCGCLSSEMLIERRTTHNLSYSVEYKTWMSMKERCFNEKTTSYKNYGGRGIAICERWLRFENFYEDMGERPEKHSIERIDNDGDYEPENCRWAVSREQNNNSRNNHFLCHDGHELTIAQWARRLSVNPQAIYSRIRKGWSTEKTLTKPVTIYKRSSHAQ